MTAAEQRQAYERIPTAVTKLHDSIGVYHDALGDTLLNDRASKGGSEARMYGVREVDVVRSQSWMYLENAADNLMGVIRVLEEPVLTIAPYGCSRIVLETCSRLLWLLDNSIDGLARLNRSYALRFDGLQDQARIARSYSNSNSLMQIASRLRELALAAEMKGVQVARREDGSIKSIGHSIPPSTNLAGDLLEAETYYRAFSAVAHNLGSSVLSSSFRPVGVHGFVEKFMSADVAAMLMIRTATWFAKGSWTYFSYLGKTSERLVAILEESYDTMALQGHERFWRGS